MIRPVLPVLAGLVLAAAPAWAQDDEELLDSGTPPPNDASDMFGGAAGEPEWSGTPQHFAFELKFGPYLPEVDSEFGSDQAPYYRTFGNDYLLLSLFQFDWEFIRIPGGTFAAGISSGFMQAVGPAKTSDGRTSGEDTVLNIVPIYYSVAFRADIFANEWHVPLVPYVKGGIATYYWWVLNGGGTAEWGWTPGWFFNPGLMLQLDFMEPGTARSFDSSMGINHSYLLVELMWAGVDGFGRGKSMILSDLSFTAGLAFEF
jgi:hypothetical protein